MHTAAPCLCMLSSEISFEKWKYDDQLDILLILALEVVCFEQMAVRWAFFIMNKAIACDICTLVTWFHVCWLDSMCAEYKNALMKVNVKTILVKI